MVRTERKPNSIVWKLLNNVELSRALREYYVCEYTYIGGRLFLVKVRDRIKWRPTEIDVNFELKGNQNSERQRKNKGW